MAAAPLPTTPIRAFASRVRDLFDIEWTTLVRIELGPGTGDLKANPFEAADICPEVSIDDCIEMFRRAELRVLEASLEGTEHVNKGSYEDAKLTQTNDPLGFEEWIYECIQYTDDPEFGGDGIDRTPDTDTCLKHAIYAALSIMADVRWYTRPVELAFEIAMQYREIYKFVITGHSFEDSIDLAIAKYAGKVDPINFQPYFIDKAFLLRFGQIHQVGG